MEMHTIHLWWDDSDKWWKWTANSRPGYQQAFSMPLAMESITTYCHLRDQDSDEFVCQILLGVKPPAQF
jgi:hypothetical protein